MAAAPDGEGEPVSVTLQDVAQLAGVSIKTVSNVVNDFPRVRPETRRRVQWAIDELGYLPNLSARGLRSGRTGIIELSLPDLRQHYFAELADDVIRTAEKRGLSVLVRQTGGDRQHEIDVVTRQRPHLADGLLFSPGQLGPKDQDLLSDAFPWVLLGEQIFDGPVDHVTMRNASAAKAAVQHLLDLGRRSIAVIGAHSGGQSEIRAAHLRVAGYRSALEEAGLQVNPALTQSATQWGYWAGAEAVKSLLQLKVPFDGLFCFNDALALGALRELAALGVRVPDDIAVIGFDNIDDGRFSVPSLTSVDGGRAEIAEVAVSLLVERMHESGIRQPPRLVETAFRIVARESTGFAGEDLAGPPSS